MLLSLSAKNYALIEDAEIQLSMGMTALTGETGAGKSLLIDALMLLCGGRADTNLIRHDCDRAELSAAFNIQANLSVRDWLISMDLQSDDICIIRRILKRDGNNRTLINDQPVTLQTLQSLTKQLITIHGQHEHQTLIHKTQQLLILDTYGQHQALLQPVTQYAQQWQILEQQIHQLQQQSIQQNQHADFLRFQIDELEQHVLTATAYQQLEQQHKRYTQQADLIQSAQQTLESLDGEHTQAVYTVLSRAVQDIQRYVDIEPKFVEITQLLQEAQTNLSEASHLLATYSENDFLDAASMETQHQQITKLHELSRKHRVPALELHDHLQQLQQQWQQATQVQTQIEQLQKEQAEITIAYQKAALALSEQRQRTAKELSIKITTTMQELNMSGSHFNIQFAHADTSIVHAHGFDRLEFYMSANVGQPEQALRKVASGGELARISLAVEVATLGQGDVSTMVFDEVDSGIGGVTAEVVGHKLRTLGQQCQVICVTHLPQVAAQAHHHYVADKQSQNQKTQTQWLLLDHTARLEELARMLGGAQINKQTKALAKEMLQMAQLEK